MSFFGRETFVNRKQTASLEWSIGPIMKYLQGNMKTMEMQGLQQGRKIMFINYKVMKEGNAPSGVRIFGPEGFSAISISSRTSSSSLAFASSS